MYGKSNMETYITIYMGICCMAQETQTGALYQPRSMGWGGRFKREGIYIYLWLIPKKEMAPHSSTLAWKIPWTEEPGRLQSMGSLRVGHD